MGRRVEQVPENYTLANFRAWTDRSRANLGVDRLDLVQLHCPPTPVYHSDAVYEALDTLVGEERIAAYGVSVETCEQALAAIAHPGVATVQIIFNAFRRKPLDQVLPAAAAAGVGIIVRVPLASGLLSGRYTLDTVFAADDHRNYNRHGEAFDVGETFSGVDYATGVRAAQAFAAIVAEPGAFDGPADQPGTTGLATTGLATTGLATTGPATTAQAALRWVTQQPGVTTVIPGARTPDQARQNAAAAAVPPLSDPALAQIEELYDKYFRAEIHARW
jgi:aryl-alcohol dehydrogenase-like predicted oxidoreductase